MKKINLLFAIVVFTSIILSSCGNKKNETRKMDPKLDSLITNLAACKEQNTNCEAYKNRMKAQKQWRRIPQINFLVDDLFNGIAQSTSGARSAACAHAINFWVGKSDHYKNAKYGKIVLDALKKEKFDEVSYVGSTLGQLLSGWLVTDDEPLLKEIHAVIKDQATEKRGRMELIRLSGKESLAKKGLFDILYSISKDNKEAEEVRIACLRVLWRAEDPTQVKKVEDLYVEFLENLSAKIVGASLEGLSYMKSVKGYDLALKTIEKNGANPDYCSSASSTLNRYISDKKKGVDTKKAFALAVKMATDKSLKAFHRSYYIYSIESFGGNEGKLILTKLSKDPEKDIANPATEALKRLNNKKV